MIRVRESIELSEHTDSHNMMTNRNEGVRRIGRRQGAFVRVQVLEERDLSSKSAETTMFLSVHRTSSFAFIVSLLYAYAWFFSSFILTTGLTGSLVLSGHESLASYNQDIQKFQHSLEDIRSETQVARDDLDISLTTCRIYEDKWFENLGAGIDCVQ